LVDLSRVIVSFKEITLDPTAKDFDERKAELKDLGYTWNSEKKAWSLQ
jgi:hypothetical protein